MNPGLRPQTAFATAFSYARGERWDFNVNYRELEQTPVWGDGELFPPLAPREAIALAAQQLNTLVDDSEK